MEARATALTRFNAKNNKWAAITKPEKETEREGERLRSRHSRSDWVPDEMWNNPRDRVRPINTHTHALTRWDISIHRMMWETLEITQKGEKKAKKKSY